MYFYVVFQSALIRLSPPWSALAFFSHLSLRVCIMPNFSKMAETNPSSPSTVSVQDLLLNWDQREIIGAGHYGKVFKCRDVHNREVAVKMCTKSSDQYDFLFLSLRNKNHIACDFSNIFILLHIFQYCRFPEAENRSKSLKRPSASEHCALLRCHTCPKWVFCYHVRVHGLG